MIKKLPIIGVMGSGKQEHNDLAEPLGKWLATLPVHLLTGGGKGVMTAVSRAFAAVENRAGLVIGILPYEKDGYPNPYVELPIQTHLSFSGVRGQDPLSRNHINILTADLVIALPGRYGTSSEVKLALKYGKPVVAFIHSQEDIPELPESVPVFSTLSELQQRIISELEGLMEQ